MPCISLSGTEIALKEELMTVMKTILHLSNCMDFVNLRIDTMLKFLIYAYGLLKQFSINSIASELSY